MKGHRFELVPFLFGLAFVMTGAAFLAHEATDSNVDPAWIVAGVCTVLGVVALAATLFHRNDERSPDEAETALVTDTSTE